MTSQSAGVDREQLAVLRRLRQAFGAVEVERVFASPELLPVTGEQTTIEE